MVDPTCPKCQSQVESYAGCHTFQQNGRWMSCMNCGSAIHYYCSDVDNCDWAYEHGLNRDNPRSAENEKNRPDWLEGEYVEPQPEPRRVLDVQPVDWPGLA